MSIELEFRVSQVESSGLKPLHFSCLRDLLRDEKSLEDKTVLQHDEHSLSANMPYEAVLLCYPSAWRQAMLDEGLKSCTLVKRQQAITCE